MRYKKDMLLILTVVMLFGAAIQVVRTDLISILAAEVRPLEKIEGYYAINNEKRMEKDNDIGAKHSIVYEMFNSLKLQ